MRSTKIKNEVKLGKGNKNQSKLSYLLESTSEKAIIQARDIAEKQLKFSWTQYSELSYQREAVIDELKESLANSCLLNYEFKNFQRAIRHKFSRHPLCTIGSSLYVGGRFNIGESINTNVTPFQALYIAENKDTALQEHLSQTPVNNSELTSREIALNNSQSESIICIDGKLDRVIDLTNKDSMNSFVKIISKFKQSNHLIDLAKHAKINPPKIIRNTTMLLEALLDKNWRIDPVQFNIPSASQIFGQIAMNAGISGIIYTSKFTGKKCIVVYLQNFNNTSNSIVIPDATHDDDYFVSSINSSNYECAEWDKSKFLIHNNSTIQ